MKDLVIIGAGPAGLTAAIYGARAGLKTLILDARQVGSQAAIEKSIVNYPGFPQGIKGQELMERFLQQARQFGAEYREERVIKLYPEEGNNRVDTEQGSYRAKAVIIATGLKYKLLGVPGESELTDKGVSYCVSSDGCIYNNKKVVVVGGDEKAIEEAAFLTQFAAEVVVIFRHERLQISEGLAKRIEGEPKLRIIANGLVVGIEGSNQVTGVRYIEGATKLEKIEQADGVFVCIGKIPNTAFLGDAVPLSKSGYVLTNAWMATEVAGIYAVGDVRKKAFRQICTAVGDGTEGALAAQHYINNLLASM